MSSSIDPWGPQLDLNSEDAANTEAPTALTVGQLAHILHNFKALSEDLDNHRGQTTAQLLLIQSLTEQLVKVLQAPAVTVSPQYNPNPSTTYGVKKFNSVALINLTKLICTSPSLSMLIIGSMSENLRDHSTSYRQCEHFCPF